MTIVTIKIHTFIDERICALVHLENSGITAAACLGAIQVSISVCLYFSALSCLLRVIAARSLVVSRYLIPSGISGPSVRDIFGSTYVELIGPVLYLFQSGLIRIG